MGSYDVKNVNGVIAPLVLPTVPNVINGYAPNVIWTVLILAVDLFLPPFTKMIPTQGKRVEYGPSE